MVKGLIKHKNVSTSGDLVMNGLSNCGHQVEMTYNCSVPAFLIAFFGSVTTYLPWRVKYIDVF